MACTEAISVLLYWLRDVVGRQFQDTPDTSQRAQPAFATQCSRPIMAAQAPEYTSPPAMEVPVKDSSNIGGIIAPPSTPVSDNERSYFTPEHHPSPRLTGYDQEQTNTMHEIQITDPRQGSVSGNAEARSSTTSSIIDLDGFIDEVLRPPRDS